MKTDSDAGAKNKGSICLVICLESPSKSFTGPYMLQAEGVEKRARENNFNVLQVTVNVIDRTDRLGLEDLKGTISGLVVVGYTREGVYSQIKASGLPFVLVGDIYGREKPVKDEDVVTNDDANGTYLAAKHLIGLGHKKIFFLTGMDGANFWEKDHVEGYKKALKEAGIPFKKDFVIETGVQKEGYAFRLMEKLIAKTAPFTGILISGTAVYFGATKAFAERGLKIPGDVSIVRLDSVFESQDSVYTRCSYDSGEMGRLAADRLVEHMNNPGSWKPRRIMVPYEIFIGTSTGAPKP